MMHLELSGQAIFYDARGAVCAALLASAELWQVTELLVEQLSDFSGPTDVASRATNWTSLGRVLLRGDAQN